LSRFIFRLEFKLLATDKRREDEENRKQIYEIREGIKEDFLTIFSRSVIVFNVNQTFELPDFPFRMLIRKTNHLWQAEMKSDPCEFESRHNAFKS